MVELLRTENGISFLRTPSENFETIPDFPWSPHYLNLDGLSMHYIDEGASDAPVALLLHGMPTWSYLYRSAIPELLAAGYRCVAPDHVGFGKSDKPTDPGYYDIARHTANLDRLIQTLDLRNITLFVQDWGGPTGLAQYAAMPQRFERLVMMNTWLHHDAYEYSDGIRNWIAQNSPGGLFRDNVPSKFLWGALMAVGTGRAAPKDTLFRSLNGQEPDYSPAADLVRKAYDAPFAGLGDDGVAGTRRFPMCIPLIDPVAGDAERQQETFTTVNATDLPVHFVWGTQDAVFTEAWGRQWHSLIPHATWDALPDAAHFPQDTHGADIARLVARYAS